MEIHISEGQLRKAVENEAACRRQFGADMTKKLMLRMAALRAAESLATFWPPKSGPERCHELKGDLTGVFSMDLKQPYRLLFKVRDQASPLDRSDEQQRWRTITSLEILAIEDTHG
jgi:plasmid maintenance system killer protein